MSDAPKDPGPDPGEPVDEVAAASEPFEPEFTDRVMGAINVRKSVNDVAELQGAGFLHAIREYLEMIFGLFGGKDHPEDD